MSLPTVHRVVDPTKSKAKKKAPKPTVAKKTKKGKS